jgi:hypothetical protein
LALLTIAALFAGVSATAAAASADPTLTLRARVDAIGNRFFAAKNAARLLDDELRALDQKLALARRRVKTLHPVAKATAVQIYQGSAQGFRGLFDVADAMESARRAELLGRAADRTQAFLDEYANAIDRLDRQRAQVATARDKQARLAADLATQQAALERLLAQAQQAYRERLAARAAAAAAEQSAATSSTAGSAVPVNRPAAPPAPTPVPAPPAPVAGANPHHDDPFLVCTRTRESSGNYGAVNPAGYYGAYQFSQPTWDVTANHAGSPQLIGVRPNLASAWDQDQLAWVLYQWQGNAPWGGLC